MNKKTLSLTVLSALTILSALTVASAVTVKHELGNLELKTPAKRVVALEYSFLDTLVALGLNPAGGSLGNQGGDRGAPPYLAPRLKDVPATGSRAQPSLEAIAAAKPDLILADAFVQKELYPQLNKLAPTAMFHSRRGSVDDLNAQTLAIGQLVGREKAARQLLADQRTLITKARAFTKKNAPTFVAAVVTPKTVTVHTNGSFVGSFLEDLGRTSALKVKGDQTQYDVSLESLIALQPQTLVLFTAPDEAPITETWKKNPLWQKIPAVSRGRVYVFNRDNWTRGRGPLALKLMVKEAIDSRLLQDAAPAENFKY